MMKWEAKSPFANSEALDKVTCLLSEHDSRRAREQIASNQVGGWLPVGGFELRTDGLVYPGKAIFPLLFETTLRNETIRVYDRDWIAVIQKDGTFEVSPISLRRTAIPVESRRAAGMVEAPSEDLQADLAAK